MNTEVLHEEIICPVGEDNPRNGDGSITELTDGRLLLAWSDFYGGQSDFSPARVSGRHSGDGGRNWSDKFTVVENTAAMNTFNPSLLRLRSGILALFYSYQDAKDNVKQYMRKSFDEGQTWSEEVCITPDRVRQFVHNDRAVLMMSGRIVLPFAWARIEH